MAGYAGSVNAILHHNIGLFILILALLDEDTSIWEYLIRCGLLINMWCQYYVNNFVQWGFIVSMVVLLVTLVLVRHYRTKIGPNFRYRLPIAVFLAADFWFTLPSRPAGMVVTPGIAAGAVLMFFLMKLSTGRQQRRFFQNLATEHLANYDELTSTKNFTAYQKDIFNHFGVARTGKQPLTVATLDIDHFKLVNDQYGHLAGNQVLAKVAQALKEIVHQYGEHYEVYRTGGEEFTVIFPNSTVKETFQIMAHCWQAIRTHEFDYDKQTIKVTISSGMTELYAGDRSPNDIYKRADHSLYISKQNGRDTITVNGATQQLQDDSNQVKYAYFVRGVYADTTPVRRIAEELQLRRYDQTAQQWVLPQQHYLDIDTRIELMRTALLNTRTQVLVKALPVADFLNQAIADKIVAFINGPDGPNQLYIELNQIPALQVLVPMANFYHANGIKLVLSQIGTNRHFTKINASLDYFDGIKFTVAAQPDQMKASKEIKFWGTLAASRQLGFSVDGVTDQRLFAWLRQQSFTNFLQGDYFGQAQLPLLAE